ncbi:MAG: hypothetical protein EAZ89_14585, partial [Bacteroidetes bacterium]
MKSPFLLFLAMFCMVLCQAQPTQKNISLVGSIAYPNNELSDVSAYVAPDGHEYAIVGTVLGVSLVDLVNPAQPVQLQILPLIPNIWRDIEVYGHYAYVSNEAGNGLRIINLESLPGQVVYKDTIIAGMNTGHTLHIDDKGYLYINGSDQF